jgi:predicted Zn-ribbon and HTH transcriptional regulator
MKKILKGVIMLKKPSELEAEYIARMEYEKKKKLEEEKHRKLAAEEKIRLKELHNMRCPKCGMELIEIEYKKIKVDKCSECEGIWLDPGELYAITKLEKTGLDRLFEVFRKQD